VDVQKEPVKKKGLFSRSLKEKKRDGEKKRLARLAGRRKNLEGGELLCKKREKKDPSHFVHEVNNIVQNFCR